MTFISAGTTSVSDFGIAEWGAVVCNLCRKTVPEPNSDGVVWAEKSELFDLTTEWTRFTDIDICPDHDIDNSIQHLARQLADK